MPFTLIAHPNHNTLQYETAPKLRVIPPISHEAMMNKIVNADILISDSGGIQEESSFLHKPLIVCRKATERPEALGITSFLCSDPQKLEALFDTLIHTTNGGTSDECPFGDGHTAEKIIKILYEQNV